MPGGGLRRGRAAGVQAAGVQAARVQAAGEVLAPLGRRAFALGSLLASWACGAAANQRSSAAEPTPRGVPLDFRFPGVDGEAVTSDSTRGRVTALLFLTTYDLASQALARDLGQVTSRLTPRTNAIAVVLEAPRYADLIPVYRQSLNLWYPVVMVDFDTRRGRGPFRDVRNVPTLVILDPRGRETFRHQGPISQRDIEAALAAANRS